MRALNFTTKSRQKLQSYETENQAAGLWPDIIERRKEVYRYGGWYFLFVIKEVFEKYEIISILGTI